MHHWNSAGRCPGRKAGGRDAWSAGLAPAAEDRAGQVGCAALLPGGERRPAGHCHPHLPPLPLHGRGESPELLPHCGQGHDERPGALPGPGGAEGPPALSPPRSGLAPLSGHLAGGLAAGGPRPGALPLVVLADLGALRRPALVGRLSPLAGGPHRPAHPLRVRGQCGGVLPAPDGRRPV